jgi:LPPG:FO 2-phospho-L-lactate transferase
MKIVALAGGVGGAKLVDGLAQILPFEDLTVIVNTGDDFEHIGLYISPDLDTVCYTLAGIVNPETGWGRLDDTFHVLENLKQLNVSDWFRLGDRDLATHIERTRRLREGQHLSQVTRDFCVAWGVRQRIFPMSDQPVGTLVNTSEFGELTFQEYFVHLKCAPKVKGFRFNGITEALPAPGVIEAISHADAIIICPSNPWVSIDPILALTGIRSAISAKKIIAVSPILAGRAVKGPAAKMYTELGIIPSALAIAQHYDNLLSGFVLDNMDISQSNEIRVETLVTDILMINKEGRRRLAQDMLNFIHKL